MTVFLPTPGQALVDPRTGHFTSTYRRWANALTEAVNAAQGGTVTVPAEPVSFVISGAGSVTADGSVAGGEFVVTLVGDKDNPPPNSFYGADTSGNKGFVPLYDGLEEGAGIAIKDSGYVVIDTVASPDDLPLTGNAGEAVRVTDDEPGLYAWDGTAFTLDVAATGKVSIALDDAPSDGNTYGRKNGAWSPSGSGPVLLGTDTISGSAGTTLSLTGLDLSAYGAFAVVVVLKNATAADATISMRFNNDTTATNYYRETIVANGATLSSSRSNDDLIATLPASGGIFARFDIANDIDGRPVATGAIQAGPVASIQLRNYARGWVTAANLTRIDIAANTANALAVGSYFKVYGVP